MGFPRRIEHFWKWRLRMSLREKVSLHKWQEYGRSPVSVSSQYATRHEEFSDNDSRLNKWRLRCLACK